MAIEDKMNLKIMRDIVAGNLVEYTDLLKPGFRKKVYDEYCAKTKKSIQSAKICFNRISNDLRPLLPTAEKLVQSLVRADKEDDRLEKMLKDLEEDIAYLKGETEKADSSMALSEQESPFLAKSKIREQMLKAIDIKQKINASVGDLSMKLYKNNIDRDKIDIAHKQLANNGPDYNALAMQAKALTDLQTAIISKYQLPNQAPPQTNFTYKVIEPDAS